MKHFETEGLNYEYFLQRFYKFDKRLQRPHKAEFIQLIESETKKNSDFEERMISVKKRLNKAVEIFDEKEVARTKSSSNSSSIMFGLISQSKTSEELAKFLVFALSQTIDYR